MTILTVLALLLCGLSITALEEFKNADYDRQLKADNPYGTIQHPVVKTLQSFKTSSIKQKMLLLRIHNPRLYFVKLTTLTIHHLQQSKTMCNGKVSLVS